MPVLLAVLTLSNAVMRIEVGASDGGLAVDDLRTGRRWTTFVCGAPVGAVRDVRLAEDRMIFSVDGPRGRNLPLRVLLQLRELPQQQVQQVLPLPRPLPRRRSPARRPPRSR